MPAPALQRIASHNLRVALRPHATSYAGLTSIHFQEMDFSNRMNCQVKPGNDNRDSCLQGMRLRERTPTGR